MAFRFKITSLVNPGSATFVTSSGCHCGIAYCIAPGGPGASVTSSGAVLIGSSGSATQFGNAIAYPGGVGGIIGDQGPGGITNGLFDAWFDGRSGGGTGHEIGGIGGGGVGETWQMDGIDAPNGSGFGGGGSAAPSPYQAGCGGGEGSKGFKVFTAGSYTYTVGAAGMPATPGVGGYRGGIPGAGKIVIFELLEVSS